MKLNVNYLKKEAFIVKINGMPSVTCIGILLSLFLVGCEPAEVGGVESDLVLSQSEDVSSHLEVTPSETVVSQEGSSIVHPESSGDVTISSASSTARMGERAGSNSRSTSSYSYSPKVADKMQKIDPENLPDYIWILLTPEASDVDKTYDSSFFPGVDVTVVEQEKQGWLPMYDGITSEPIENHPEIMLTLKVNGPGWENFQQVVAALDCRDDISIIDFEGLGILE